MKFLLRSPLPQLVLLLAPLWAGSCGDERSSGDPSDHIESAREMLTVPLQGFLTVRLAGPGIGTVTLQSKGTPDRTCSSSCAIRYPIGAQVQVTADPGHGSFVSQISGSFDSCVANQCTLTLRPRTADVTVSLNKWDNAWADTRLALIRELWNQDTIPSWPPALIEDLGQTMPPPMAEGLIPENYSMDDAPAPPRLGYGGDFRTANLDHYERWAMRPAPDVHGLGYKGTNGSWGWVPFPPVPGQDPHVSEPQAYVPVFYFAPAVPTTKLFIIHDGHAAYGQAGHRALIKWALDHGFGVAQIIMPYFAHDVLWWPPLTWWPPDQGDMIRIFFEATTNTISHAETLGYTTFVMEGISGGGWTTHFAAALDPRITVSYPIAGAMPFDLRAPLDIGDAEQQRIRAVYDVADYDALFAMSATNGRHVTQILGEFDPCCFAANGREDAIAAYANLADSRTSGVFRTVIDPTASVHDVTPYMISVIEDDLRSLGMIK